MKSYIRNKENKHVLCTDSDIPLRRKQACNVNGGLQEHERAKHKNTEISCLTMESGKELGNKGLDYYGSEFLGFFVRYVLMLSPTKAF